MRLIVSAGSVRGAAFDGSEGTMSDISNEERAARLIDTLTRQRDEARRSRDVLVKAAKKVRDEFCEHGAPLWKTDEHLPNGYWSPSARMTDSAVMMSLFAALALAERT